MAPRALAAQDSQDREYKAVVDDALEEYKLGHWEEAYALFARAHAVAPSARTSRGMGLSAFQGRHYVTAMRDLTAALADKRRELDDAQRREAQRVLGESQGFVARLTLSSTPSDARMSVDGRPPELDAQRRILLDPGGHEIVLEAPGHRAESRRVIVQAGETLALQVALQGDAGSPLAGASLASDEDGTRAQPTATESDEPGIAPIWGYVATGAAVVFAGGALAFHLSAAAGASDVRDTCRGMCTPAQIDAEIADAGIERDQTLSYVGWALAGASAISAGVLFALAAGDAQASVHDASAAAVRWSIGAGTASVRIGF